jgi:hypothetical protein
MKRSELILGGLIRRLEHGVVEVSAEFSAKLPAAFVAARCENRHSGGAWIGGERGIRTPGSLEWNQ